MNGVDKVEHRFTSIWNFVNSYSCGLTSVCATCDQCEREVFKIIRKFDFKYVVAMIKLYESIGSTTPLVDFAKAHGISYDDFSGDDDHK